MKAVSLSLMPALLLLIGCGGSSGPEVATVSGTVKMDGQPLADAGVVFIPENGRPASARTDENGQYELQYTGDTAGAIPGRNMVRITTATFETENEDGETIPGKPETVPAEFNVKTTLTFDVKPNEANVADWDLKSGGEVVTVESFDDAGD